MCTLCANLNKTTAKQPSFIYQVAPSVSRIYHIEKWIWKVDTTQLAKLFAFVAKPFGCKWYIQPFDLIKRNFNKNVYSKKVVSAHFQLYDQ